MRHPLYKPDITNETMTTVGCWSTEQGIRIDRSFREMYQYSCDKHHKGLIEVNRLHIFMNYKDYKNNLLEYEVFNYPLQNYLVLRLLKTNQRYQGDQKGQARFNAWPFKDFIL